MGSRRKKTPEELLELWKGEVLSLLTVSKMGVEYRQVERELEDMSGERIPIYEMGFNSIGDFLYAIRDVHQVCVLYGEDPSNPKTRLFLFIREDAVNEDTKNVLRLVQGQDKGKIKRRRDGTISKPSRNQVRACNSEYLRSRRSYPSTASTPLMNGFFSSRPLPSSRGGSIGRTNFFPQRLQQEQEQRRLREQEEQRRLREEIEQKRKEQEQRRLREELEQRRLREELERKRFKEQELKRIREEMEEARLKELRRIREEIEQERLKEQRQLREELEQKRLREELERKRFKEQELKRIREEMEQERLKEQERLREEAERIKNEHEKSEIRIKQEKMGNGIGEDATDYKALDTVESEESIEFSKTHPGMARIRSIRTMKLRNLARQKPNVEHENDLSYTTPTSLPHVYPPPCSTRPVERIARVNLEPNAEFNDGVNLQPHRVNRPVIPHPVIGSQFLDGVLKKIAGMQITRSTEGTSQPKANSPHKILRTSMYD